jgi:predicted nucleic acid-binding protein
MRLLVDTNVLLRLANPQSGQPNCYEDALVSLLRHNHELFLVPQVIYEFWSVATRQVDSNGLGMASTEAMSALDRFGAIFELLFGEESQIHTEWRRLIHTHSVTGRHVHDTRLVAAMNVHRLDGLVSADAGFAKYGINLLNPLEITKTN